MEKIMSWWHTGFSVHSKVRAKTRQEVERMRKYVVRPPLSSNSLAHLLPFFAQVDVDAHYFLSFACSSSQLSREYGETRFIEEK